MKPDWRGLKLLTLLTWWLPFLRWPLTTMWRHTRVDLEAGLIGAFIAIPQAIALTTLIGIPLEYGIYASIVPSVIAMLWGSSWHTINAPNTEITLLLAGAIIPFAAIGSSEFIGYLLLLTLMIGCFQLLVALLRLGNVLNFVSSTVVVGITHAVALYIIVAAVASMLGVQLKSGTNLVVKIEQIINSFPLDSGYSLGIGVLTITTGIAIKMSLPRYTLLAVFASGILYFTLLQVVNPGIAAQIPLAKVAPVSFTLNSPIFLGMVDLSMIHHLLGSALAITFVSLMQTEVIARTMAEKTQQQHNTNQEIVGQGLANLIAPFVSAFAVSGSYSRSANHIEAGARTPAALLYSIAGIILIILLGQPLLELLPAAAISATLLLVGIGLINLEKIRRAFLSSAELAILCATFFASITISLNAGILAGLLLSLMLYLRITSVPKLSTTQFVARNGKTVSSVNMDGNLFFGSLPSVKQRLPGPPKKMPGKNILLLKTDHLTYIDLLGAELIIRELKTWRDKGELSYVYITRGAVLRALRMAKFTEFVDKDALILRDRSHPMKHILHPYSKPQNPNKNLPSNTDSRKVKRKVKKLAQSLNPAPFRGPVSEKQLFSVLAHALDESSNPAPVKLSVFNFIPSKNAAAAHKKMKKIQLKAGDVILREGKVADRYFMVQKGQVEVIRPDPFTGETKTVAHLGVGEGFGEEELPRGKACEKTYRMLTLGSVKALPLSDFNSLILPFMTKAINSKSAKERLQQGKAILLDVRHDLEYKKKSLPGSKLVPLHQLSEKIKNLKPDYFYITYCDNEKRSRVATFLLLEYGLESATLTGGMQGWND